MGNKLVNVVHLLWHPIVLPAELWFSPLFPSVWTPLSGEEPPPPAIRVGTGPPGSEGAGSQGVVPMGPPIFLCAWGGWILAWKV